MSQYSVIDSQQYYKQSFIIRDALFIVSMLDTPKIYISINGKTASFLVRENIHDLDFKNVRAVYVAGKYYLWYSMRDQAGTPKVLSVRTIYLDEDGDIVINHGTDPYETQIEGTDIQMSEYQGTLITSDKNGAVYQYRPDYNMDRQIVISNGGSINVTSHALYTIDDTTYMILANGSKLQYFNLSAALDRVGENGPLSTDTHLIDINMFLFINEPPYVGAYVSRVGNDVYAYFGYGATASSQLSYKIQKLDTTSITLWGEVSSTDISMSSFTTPNNWTQIFTIDSMFYVNGQLFVLGDGSRLFTLINDEWRLVSLKGNAKSDNGALEQGYAIDRSYTINNNTLYLTVITLEENTDYLRYETVYYDPAANEMRFIRFNDVIYNTRGKFQKDNTMYISASLFMPDASDNMISTPITGVYKLNADNTLDLTRNYARGVIIHMGHFNYDAIYAGTRIDMTSSLIKVPLYTATNVSDIFTADSTPDEKQAAFKTFLTSSNAVEPVVLTNVNASVLFGGDILPEEAARFANVRVTAVSAPDLDPMAGVLRRVEFERSQLANLFVIPFNSGHFELSVIGDKIYNIRFDINRPQPPFLIIDNVGVNIGGDIEIAGIQMRFLTRGSIWLNPALANSFPSRMRDFRAKDRIILFTIDTIEAAVRGGTLPTNQGRYLGVAGDCFRDLGKQVNLYTLVRGVPMVAYTFRSAQLINGPTTEGVGGSAADDYVSGYLCTWAASGVAPATL